MLTLGVIAVLGLPVRGLIPSLKFVQYIKSSGCRHKQANYRHAITEKNFCHRVPSYLYTVRERQRRKVYIQVSHSVKIFSQAKREPGIPRVSLHSQDAHQQKRSPFDLTPPLVSMAREAFELVYGYWEGLPLPHARRATAQWTARWPCLESSNASPLPIIGSVRHSCLMRRVRSLDCQSRTFSTHNI